MIVSSSVCAASNVLIINKNELEGMWKETAITLFNILSQHFLGVTEEHQGNQSKG
jgi:hypothetical protein